MTYHFDNRNLLEYKNVVRDITHHVTCIYEFLCNSKDISEINHWFKHSKLYHNENFFSRQALVNNQIDAVRRDLNKLSEASGELASRIVECKNIIALEVKKDQEFAAQYNKYHKIKPEKIYESK